MIGGEPIAIFRHAIVTLLSCQGLQNPLSAGFVRRIRKKSFA
jgi:hypothetical protein